MDIAEFLGMLNDRTPDDILRGEQWLMDRGQPGVATIFLTFPAAIDRVELQGKRDEDIKVLILERILDGLNEFGNKVEAELNKLGVTYEKG